MSFSRNIRIHQSSVSDHSPVFIIAEAGVNHNGDAALAKRLIDAAAESGADAVKFQLFKAEHLILKGTAKAPYQLNTTAAEESQFDMLKKLELSIDQYWMLSQYCRKKNILFLMTPFDEQSLEALDVFDLPAYKISSTDNTNLLFLKKAARKGKPLLLSTGMVSLAEIERVLKEISPLNRDLILLQCTSNYPVLDEEVNLKVIQTYQEKFGILTGFSDHTAGIGAAPYAAAMGAKVIEKHFTMDKNLPGPDHRASLNPDELKELVHTLRKVEKYLGSPIKTPALTERQTRLYLQKYLVSSRKIKKGSILTEEDMIAKRTGGIGLSPLDYDRVVGQRARRDYQKDDILEMG